MARRAGWVLAGAMVLLVAAPLIVAWAAYHWVIVTVIILAVPGLVLGGSVLGLIRWEAREMKAPAEGAET